MSISQPIIAASSLSRGAVKTVVIPVSSTVPPADRVVAIDGVATVISQSPEREGQMIAYRASGELQLVDLYVVVDIEGVLTWVPVLPSVIPIDPRSGKMKDPLYDIYGLHA